MIAAFPEPNYVRGYLDPVTPWPVSKPLPRSAAWQAMTLDKWPRQSEKTSCWLYGYTNPASTNQWILVVKDTLR